MEYGIDYNGLVSKTKQIIEAGLTGMNINVGLQEPGGNDVYPYVWIMRPVGSSEEDISIGTTPEEVLYIPVMIITYQGEGKNQIEIEEEAYDILNTLKNIVRQNRETRWDNFPRLQDVENGGFTPVSADRGFFKLQFNINFQIRAFKQGG
ncbi:hypothetical protein J7K25_00930 [bacterium]|nr:hypothetical protein [bacterium]